MNDDAIFSLANVLALCGWLILIFFPRWYNADKFIVGIIVTLLCGSYLFLMLQSFSLKGFQDFGSLQGIRTLFSDNKLLLAGWIHYLAFDLMVGIFIKKNAEKQAIGHWLILPSFIFTFLLGPAGLLLYLITRWLHTRTYFEDNF